MLSCRFLTLDWTVVWFQSLPSSKTLMVLEKGAMWTRSKVGIKSGENTELCSEGLSFSVSAGTKTPRWN